MTRSVAAMLLVLATTAGESPEHRHWQDCHHNKKGQVVCRTCWIAEGRVHCGQPRIRGARS